MNQEMIDLIEYFTGKELPESLDIPGGKINNVKLFVLSQILRMKEGVPVIQQASYRALLDLKERIK